MFVSVLKKPFGFDFFFFYKVYFHSVPTLSNHQKNSENRALFVQFSYEFTVIIVTFSSFSNLLWGRFFRLGVSSEAVLTRSLDKGWDLAGDLVAAGVENLKFQMVNSHLVE